MRFPAEAVMTPDLREEVRLVAPRHAVIPDGARLEVVHRLAMNIKFLLNHIETAHYAHRVVSAEASGRTNHSAAAHLQELTEEKKRLPIVKRTNATPAEILAADFDVQTSLKTAHIKFNISDRRFSNVFSGTKR